ncbi:XisI protein [Laspinema sp. D1]|nr:XisI protein [Laspinema sp. D2b]
MQRNGTELDIACGVVEMGVPQSDIILGLHPPYKRPYTGYGNSELIHETVSI